MAGAKEYTTNIETFRRVVEKKRCNFCVFVWDLFSKFPPEEGWLPTGKESVTLRTLRSRYNCFVFSMRSDKRKTSRPIDDGFVGFTQSSKDAEHILEVYPYLRRLKLATATPP